MSDFWLGIILTMCWQNGLKQFIGKERYLEVAGIIWTHEPWWVWPLVGAVCIFLRRAEKWVKARTEEDSNADKS